MGVQIVDCTIRDGGYLFNKKTDPQFVKEVIQNLSEAGIEFIEIGFLQNNISDETIVYNNSVEARKYINDCKKATNFVGFCDNSRYSLEKLDKCDGKSFQWIRISFAQHEIEQAINFCKGAMDKGYKVQCNPMDSVGYTDEARKNLIAMVNEIKPQVFSIVDTFGAMDMTELEHIFTQVDSLLDSNIKIGLHSHDNIGLSCALAERMIDLASKTNREVLVDASLFGMGRGAGNAKTELLADYINKHYGGTYNIPQILNVIEQFIVPLQDRLKWGYSVPMFVCGTKHSHIDNVIYLQNKYGSRANELFDVVELLPDKSRTRYGTGYSKEDFSLLDSVYKKYKEGMSL